MTTFKGGGGPADDPFTGDDSDEDDEQRDEDERRDGAAETADVVDDVQDEPAGRDRESDASGPAGLPWIYERNGITDGREKTVQLHLQKSTVDEEDDAQSELKDLLGEKPQKADVREATHRVGMQHLDEVADQLREWGYDFE